MIEDHNVSEEDLLTISEAARISGVTEKTLREWDASGKLKAFRTKGGHRRYRIGDLRQGKLVSPSIYDDLVLSDQLHYDKSKEPLHQFWLERDQVNKGEQDLSVLLSTVKAFCSASSIELDANHDYETYIEVTKAIWRSMSAKQFVMIHPLMGPCGLIFYMQQKSKIDNEIDMKVESMAVNSRTESYRATANFNYRLEENTEAFGKMLARELDVQILENMKTELSMDEEMLMTKTLAPKPDHYVVITALGTRAMLEQYQEFITLDGNDSGDEGYKSLVAHYEDQTGNPLQRKLTEKEMPIMQKIGKFNNADLFLTPVIDKKLCSMWCGKWPDTHLAHNTLCWMPYCLVLQAPTTVTGARTLIVRHNFESFGEFKWVVNTEPELTSTKKGDVVHVEVKEDVKSRKT